MTADLDRQIVRMNEGRLNAAALDVLEQTVPDISDAVDLKIFRLMDEGKLEPDVAIMAWAEKYAYHKLRRRLETAVRTGRGAAVRAAPFMNMEDPNAAQA